MWIMVCTFIKGLNRGLAICAGMFSELATFNLYTSKTPVQLLRGGVFFSLTFLSVRGVEWGGVCCLGAPQLKELVPIGGSSLAV